MAGPISQDQLDGVGRSRPVDFSRAVPPYSVLTGALSLPGGVAHTTHLANSRGPLRTWPAAQDRMPCGCAGCGSHTGCDHPDAAVLLFARMLIGLATGADSAIATAYIAE